MCGLNHKIKSKSIIDPGLVRAETWPFPQHSSFSDSEDFETELLIT